MHLTQFTTVLRFPWSQRSTFIYFLRANPFFSRFVTLGHVILTRNECSLLPCWARTATSGGLASTSIRGSGHDSRSHLQNGIKQDISDETDGVGEEPEEWGW